jgi:PepB aminopeptidase
MSTQMSVFISTESAQPQWGEGALLSYNEQGVVIHLKDTGDFTAIQRAARKLDGQGLHDVVLTGEGWALESIWAFYQGYREPKKRNQVTWSELDAASQQELEARIKATDWARDIINKSAEEVAPRQLATMAGEFIKSLAPEHVTYKIVKDKDLLTCCDYCARLFR